MRLNPYLSVLLAATLGATTGIFVKYLQLPATTLTFFRVSVPLIVMLVYLTIKKVRLFRGNYRMMLAASTLNAARLFLYYVGYIYTTIGNGVIMLFTWPIFGAIFAKLMLKERISLKHALLIAMAFTGIIFMYLDKELSFSNNDFIGMGAMLLSAIILALAMVIFKKELKFYSPAETVFYQNLVGAVIFLPFMFFNALPSLGQAGGAMSLGLLTGVIGFWLFFYALKRLTMVRYGILTYWEMPAGILFGALIFSEILTWNMAVGAVLIVASSLLITKDAL